MAKPSPERPELLVYDSEEPCPYLPSRAARMPLRMPLYALSPGDLDERLVAGDRRTGAYLYKTACPGCQACEPIRLPVGRFQPNRTGRRVLRRGDRELRLEVGVPKADPARVALFNLHRSLRGLSRRQGDIDAYGYQSFLVDTCCPSLELSCWRQGQLVAVAVCDRGADSLNAVYCYYDPRLSSYSLGAYCILKEVELCRQWDLTWLYLGLYVAESAHMAYKASYLPHERLIGGVWRAFEK